MSAGFLFLLGLVVLVVGLMMFAGWFDWILRIGGIVLIIIGIIGIVVGAINLMGGRNRGGRGF